MTETSLGEHLGTAAKIWEDAILMLVRRKGLDPEERQRWTELYEYEAARAKGQGVTADECGKLRARLESWALLRRSLPTRTPPDEDTFLLYCAVQKRLADYRRGGGERVPDAELERAGRFGRAHFYRWYDPVADEIAAITRTISKLQRFGTEDDADSITALQERGNKIMQWLRYQVSSDIVQWLPEFSDSLRPIDEWWREDVSRKMHKDVITFWEARR